MEPWETDDIWTDEPAPSSPPPASSKPVTPPISPKTGNPVPPSRATSGSAWETSTRSAAETVVRLLRDAQPRIEAAKAWLQPRLEQLRPLWIRLLTLVRSILPNRWNAKLSDDVLGVVVGTVLLVSLWFLSDVIATPAKTPEPPTPVEVTPDLPSSLLPTVPLVKPAEPPPVLNRSLEDGLIASIQENVAQVTDQFSDSLIQAVQANFRTAALTVQVGDRWYDLRTTQQNQLGNELLGRSRELSFSHLELVDGQGNLLARSPVVGDDLVILKRSH